MNLVEYRSLLRNHPLPTPAQVHEFVDYVSAKHSWYKHLPLTPPGVRFCVFLDPCAGMQRFQDSGGEVRMQEIAESECFHHAMMPTDDYLRRFGVLAVRDRGAPQFELIGEEGTAHHEVPPGVWTGTEFRSIPSEVQFAGTVTVTGVIHDVGSAGWIWEEYLDPKRNRFNRDPATLTWPKESGGPAVLEEIKARLLANRTVSNFNRLGIDALIASERMRQRQVMRERAQRVIDLLADVKCS